MRSSRSAPRSVAALRRPIGADGRPPILTIVARIAPRVGVGRCRRHGMRCAGTTIPFLSHAFLSRARRHRAASATGTGWHPLPILVERDGAHDRRRARLSQERTARANMCSTMAGPTRGSARAGLLSQAADRGAVHAGAGPRACSAIARAASARRARSGDGAERAVVGAHHFIDAGRRSPQCDAARLADPRRHPISIGSTAAMRASTTSSPRSSSRKRKAIRKERAAALRRARDRRR